MRVSATSFAEGENFLNTDSIRPTSSFAYSLRVKFAMNGVCIEDIHGINGATPELTMKNMGYIASPGMTGTEKAMVEILEKMILLAMTIRRKGKSTRMKKWML